MIGYYPPSQAAGYMGFVSYNTGFEMRLPCNCSIWIIPGTWEYDWENQ